MKAIILAAGQGSRMGEITKDIPKSLIEINNKPILLKQIESLIENNITDISVVIGFRKEKVKEACKNYDLKFYEFEQYKEKGLLEGLYSAKDELNDDLILVYGDVYFEKEVIERFILDKNDFCIGVDESKKDDPFAKKEVETYYSIELQKGSTKVSIEKGVVKEISKKIEKNRVNGTYIGLTKMKQFISRAFRDKIRELIDTGEIKKYPGPSYLLNEFIKKGHKIHPVFVRPNSYIEIDYPEDLEMAKKIFENKIKAVLFDAEDVIYIRDSDTLKPLIDMFSTHKGINVSGREIVKANNIYKLDSFKGIITKDDNLKRTLELLKISYDDEFFQKFKEVFIPTYSNIKANEHAEYLLKKLKEEGIKIAIITDSYASEEKKWQMFRSISLDSYIDIIVSSNDTGFTKDHKEPYLKALEKLNLNTSEAVFVGHQQYEMDGAKKAGVKSISLGEKIKSDYFAENLKDILKIINV